MSAEDFDLNRLFIQVTGAGGGSAGAGWLQGESQRHARDQLLQEIVGNETRLGIDGERLIRERNEAVQQYREVMAQRFLVMSPAQRQDFRRAIGQWPEDKPKSPTLPPILPEPGPRRFKLED